jgi:SAM-dependent methyltransferase
MMKRLSAGSENMMDLGGLADGIALESDGVWYSRTRTDVSYPADGNVQCAQVEEKSFWFGHRNRCILALTHAYPPPGAIFDIGGGNGYVTHALVTSGLDAVLVEPGPAGARAAKARGLDNVVCATLDDAKFRNRSIPAIGLFDVIEHIRDDSGFMRRVYEILTAGGRLYLTVPAHAWLWSTDDVDAGHHRRHSLGSVSELIESAGFKVDFATYIFRFLPVPIFLLRTIPTRLGFRNTDAPNPQRMQREHGAHRGGLARLLTERLLAPEIGRIRRSIPMRVGASCLLAASRR